MTRKNSTGFTLVEVMIVVAIVGILAAIAYPSYQDSVRKGRRAQARMALSDLLQQQERRYTQRNTYLSFTTTDQGVPTAVSETIAAGQPFPFRVFSSDSSVNSAYVLTSDACPSGVGNAVLAVIDCIQVNARPLQMDPAVNILSLTTTGGKSCTDAANTVISKTDAKFKLCWP